ncbi:MAG: tetraacyldisaccharide 4'-kinase [Thermodesulfobacteriota bacterium]
MSRGLDLYTPHPPLWRRALARLYRRLVGGRLFLYERGLAKPRALPVRVVSVGNLTVGGTGKTPLVMTIARELSRRGLRPAVVSRGYRGRGRAAVNVVSDGARVLLGPAEAGDEPYLLARSLPGVPVLTGRDRYLAGLAAVEDFGAGTIVLDDGFQHIQLARNADLLLLDARRPWGNGFLLPAGPLREPPEQAARATAFVLTRAGGGESATEEELRARFPGRPVFTARRRPVRLTDLAGTTEMEPGWLRGRRVVAFCGLARPEAFLETLAGLGVRETLLIKWPDHYRPRDRDLRLIEAKVRELGADGAVTTAKDAVKLAGRSLGNGPARPFEAFVLEVEMEITGRADDFLRHVTGE